ncbi:MAG: hypothetical protein ABI567_01560 [Gammaproteobacteria bacterium]
MHPILRPPRSLLPALFLAFVGQGALASTWNLESGATRATGRGSSWGNQLTFTHSHQSLRVSAWSDTGSPEGTFEAAYLGRFSTGLGVCNRGEGSIPACINAGLDHQVDNVSQQDLVLFLFDTPQTLLSLTIDPWGVWDRDVSFWVGNVSPTLSLGGATRATLAALGFGAQVDSFNSAGDDPLPVSLGGRVGNALLVSALFPADSSPDRFKIQTLVTSNATVVPAPAALWLLASALGSLAGLRRCRS